MVKERVICILSGNNSVHVIFDPTQSQTEPCDTCCKAQLPSPHTGDNVEAVVEDVLGEWSIPREKVSAILTDNGSNTVKAFREWLTDLHEASDDSGEDESQEHAVAGDGGNSPSTTGSDDESGEEMDVDSHGKVDHEIHEFDNNESEYDAAFILHTGLGLRCFSHSLQLVVRKFDTVKGLKRTRKIAHKLVSKVCKSMKATEKLVSLSGRKLVNDVPTRWNSTFIMISRLLEVRVELSQVLAELNWNTLQNSEWKQLENLYTLLKPFAKYIYSTNICRGLHYPFYDSTSVD